VRTLLVGPVNTELFAQGKPSEVMERIAQQVGLYTPEEFAAEVLRALEEKAPGYQEVRMYATPKENTEPQARNEMTGPRRR
jgi:short-subunit dehydrogenase